MRLLATAKPNMEYKHFHNINSFKLQVCIIDRKVHFLEHYNGHINDLSEDLVKRLFPVTVPHNEKPFLSIDNKDFYCILHRKKRRFKQHFQEILKGQTKHGMYRNKK
jgi:hypothetical protein